MHIGVIGINHKSADVRLREKLAKTCERLFGPKHLAHAFFSYVLLSTCNRTEIYFHSQDPAQTHTYLLKILRRWIDEEFEHRIYSYFGRDCFFHLARVTAGVDSALIGETEIQGQVKRAYESARQYGHLAKELHFLFQKCLKVAKNIRSHFSLEGGAPTLDEAIVNAGSELLGEMKSKSILFVGVSEINHKIFLNFKQRGFCQMTFCNRSEEKVIKMAEREGTGYLPWNRLYQWSRFDIAIFGTKSPHFLVESSEKYEKGDSCRLIIDLSIPRNVDPKVGRYMTLLNIDQLNKAIDRKRKLKAEIMGRIEVQHIALAVEKQVEIFNHKEMLRPHTLSLEALG